MSTERVQTNMSSFRKIGLATLVTLILTVQIAAAQTRPSECQAVAQNLGAIFHFAALGDNEARLTYAGHSTFIIESPQGIRIATDYAGRSGGITPDVATMNHAHGSHYTDFPDPAVKHVLKGWGELDKPAAHDLDVGDVRIRNVTTDIRAGEFTREKDGNSIFIFETAGLCIGHLGHLHHELAPEHIASIGRLDVVMVPVDGGMTLPLENMMNVLQELRVRVILPMHARFAGSLARFTATAGKVFKVNRLHEDTIVVSIDTLPPEPTVYIMPGM
jgi:L-ascorbate metabolism protein UlaG (beta-lactamase superfamily)